MCSRRAAPRGSCAIDRSPTPAKAHAEAGRLTAPMPGKVVVVRWPRPATRSATGQALAVMEAMKMEHTIAAPATARWRSCLYAAGDQVGEGGELLRCRTGAGRKGPEGPCACRQDRPSIPAAGLSPPRLLHGTESVGSDASDEDQACEVLKAELSAPSPPAVGIETPRNAVARRRRSCPVQASHTTARRARTADASAGGRRRCPGRCRAAARSGFGSRLQATVGAAVHHHCTFSLRPLCQAHAARQPREWAAQGRIGLTTRKSRRTAIVVCTSPE